MILTWELCVVFFTSLCQSSGVDLKTKEEKDAELDRRIEALRKKNEALVKRYQVGCLNIRIKLAMLCPSSWKIFDIIIFVLLILCLIYFHLHFTRLHSTGNRRRQKEGGAGGHRSHNTQKTAASWCRDRQTEDGEGKHNRHSWPFKTDSGRLSCGISF